jgi:hypothetical protein
MREIKEHEGRNLGFGKRNAKDAQMEKESLNL